MRCGGLAPFLLSLLVLVVMPESRCWLVTRNGGDEARLSVARLQGVSVVDVPEHIGAIVKGPSVSLREVYARPLNFWLVVQLWACLVTCNCGVSLREPAIAGAIVHLPYGPTAGYFVCVAGIAGRLAFSILPNFLGRRKSVEIFGYGVAFTFIGVALFSQQFV